MKTPKEIIIAVQTALGVEPDSWWGPLSQGALDAAIAGTKTGGIILDGTRYTQMASSFADPGDVAAFHRCKSRGGSDQTCFKSGDNGVGAWGDDTTADRPMCALPPEDWQRFGATARGKQVRVQANGRAVICELRDTMPHRANIKNGADIDLNPAAVAALGLHPPIMQPCSWTWV